MGRGRAPRHLALGLPRAGGGWREAPKLQPCSSVRTHTQAGASCQLANGSGVLHISCMGTQPVRSQAGRSLLSHGNRGRRRSAVLAQEEAAGEEQHGPCGQDAGNPEVGQATLSLLPGPHHHIAPEREPRSGVRATWALPDTDSPGLSAAQVQGHYIALLTQSTMVIVAWASGCQ